MFSFTDDITDALCRTFRLVIMTEGRLLNLFGGCADLREMTIECQVDGFRGGLHGQAALHDSRTGELDKIINTEKLR